VNPYFETLGRTLGFERVKHYANQFGLGELAGYNIQGEQLGTYPDHELPAEAGWRGRMCSFGESISMTPLQLGAMVSAIANGGTLYYLQHPQTPGRDCEELYAKGEADSGYCAASAGDAGRHARWWRSLWDGAKSLRANFNEFPVMGKTGTCSNNGTRFGWLRMRRVVSYLPADTPTDRAHCDGDLP
jgi:penicillin-binding protein 2